MAAQSVLLAEAINNHYIVADDADVSSIWLRLAEDTFREDQIAAWLRNGAARA